MNDIRPAIGPAPTSSCRRRARRSCGPTGRVLAHHPPLDGDAAVDLLNATTGPRQSVVDFDDDPLLRVAARAAGRRYRPLPVRLQSARGPSSGTREADLVTLAWPRPHDPSLAAGADALAVASGLLLPGGHVAVLLEQTLPRSFTITWTGVLLNAARQAHLDYLQDILCLHAGPEAGGDPDGERSGPRHRVVLVLRHDARA